MANSRAKPVPKTRTRKPQTVAADHKSREEYKAYCLAMLAKCDDPLEAAQWAFAAGDKRVLLETVVMYSFAGIPVPQWAAMELWEIYNDPPNSWDDAFDPPPAKGQRAADKERHRRLRPLILLEIAMAKEAGQKIVYADIGKKHGISAAQVGRICGNSQPHNRDFVSRTIDLMNSIKVAKSKADASSLSEANASQKIDTK